MKLIYSLLIATAAASAMYNQAGPKYQPAQIIEARQLRAPRIVDQALPAGVIVFEPSEAVTSDAVSLPTRVISDFPSITEAPLESTSTCTPLSICVDGITCGHRFGGCYDKNFCTGTSSYKVPSVTCDYTSTRLNLSSSTAIEETTADPSPDPTPEPAPENTN